ncbi:MAG: hypothetical protein E7183_04840 [Erysipelotrichaceae bacterium]|nr:hypothetical protein [Erysipelotrichaceae bacterium]
MKKTFIKTCLLVCLVLIATFCVSCDKKCKEHNYVDGVCSKCEAVDPDYKPHTHEFVEGTCECGEKDPNYVDPIIKLEESMNLLSTSSYTANIESSISMSAKQGSVTNSQSIVMNIYMECDPTHSYSVMTMDGEKQNSYAIIDGDVVKQYLQYEGEWMLAQILDITEYSDTTDIFDVEVKDAFTLQDGVYVGNLEVLSEVLAETMSQMSEELVGMGGTMKETSIKKYNITLVDGKVASIDIEMFMSMLVEGMTIEISYNMPMTMSKVGETTVTVPENLPVV